MAANISAIPEIIAAFDERPSHLFECLFHAADIADLRAVFNHPEVRAIRGRWWSRPKPTDHLFKRARHPYDVSPVDAENGLVVAFIGVMDHGDLIRS